MAENPGIPVMIHLASLVSYDEREKWTLYHVPGITLKDADDIIDWYKRYLASIGKLDEELAEIRRLWKEFPVD